MNDTLLDRLVRLDAYTAEIRKLLASVEFELELIEAWARSARKVAAHDEKETP